MLYIPLIFSGANPPDNHLIDSLNVIANNYYGNNNKDSAYFYYKEASKLSDETNYPKGTIESRIGLANCILDKGDYPQTLKITNDGLNYLSHGKLTIHNWSPTLYYLKGYAEYKLKDPEKSIQSIETGIAEYAIWNKQPDSILTLLYKTLGNDHLLLRNYEGAKTSYEIALNNELTREDTNLLAASLIMNIGIIYSQKGEYIKGEEYFERSLKINERISPNSLKWNSSIYSNIGRLQTIIGKIDEALINYNKAENIYLNKYGPESENLIPLYLNKGGLYLLKNDFEQALTYHEKALELAIRFNSPEDQIFYKIYGNLGLINKNQYNFQKAIDWLNKANLNNISINSRIRNYRTMATCYQNLGDMENARYYYENAVNAANNDKSGNLNILHYCYLDFGTFNDKLGNYGIGEKYLSKAVELFRKDFGENSNMYANSITVLGNHYTKTGNFTKALGCFQKAIVILSDDFNDTSIYSNPNKNQISPITDLEMVLENKAKTLFSLYQLEPENKKNLKASYETCKLAIYTFEKLRTDFTGEKNKLYATEESNMLYKLTIGVSLELAKTTLNKEYIREAFVFSEKSKSAVLLSTINDSKAMNFGGIPNNIISLERELKNDIAIYSNLIYEENLKQQKNIENLSLWRSGLITKNRKYDSLISLIELKYPQYYEFKYSSPIVDISKLQSSLSNEEVLVEYDLLDSTLIVFTITTDSINYKEIRIDSSFKSNIRDFTNITHNYPHVDNAKERLQYFANLSHNLFNVLIEPIYQTIKYKKEIIIIPDDVLGYISFEALIKELPEPNVMGYKNLGYLIRDYYIRYSYSASLITNPKRKTVKTSNVLAIAPSYSKESTIPITKNNLGSSLSPLDYAKIEVKNIQEHFTCTILEGEDATEKKFIKLAGDFDILHFSMHTLIDNEQPLASKLVFTLNNDSIYDGFLNTYEIYSLPLKAQLAVLSACETGGGKLSKGEGVLSLARGFIYSGVPSIVMTLWEIDDISSSEIISGFYERLKAGDKIDKALRLAKLNYLQSTDQLHAHPYFWSAYVQIGDNSSITANSKYFPSIAIIFLVLLLIIIYLIRKKRKTRIN